MKKNAKLNLLVRIRTTKLALSVSPTQRLEPPPRQRHGRCVDLQKWLCLALPRRERFHIPSAWLRVSSQGVRDTQLLLDPQVSRNIDGRTRSIGEGQVRRGLRLPSDQQAKESIVELNQSERVQSLPVLSSGDSAGKAVVEVST
ncbi:hypothetical protein CJ030_MR6G001839 [Morella rubra]|uniref:Uncharacterized protein n=1 Tax=Morella rubra TaxID=262757 RepID=A0A6A1VA35_9ROSI|nr:hypothetical protein CJ030_MR6G001839 [Morella rubra]